MPKQVLNIVDFSGGINKAVDKRDLEANELVLSDGLISYEPGKLTLSGTFNNIPGLQQNTGSFSANYVSEGIPNLYGVFPELAFRVFGKAKCTAEGAEATFSSVPTNTFHSLDRGAMINIVSAAYISTGGGAGGRTSRDSVNDTLIITEIINDTSFKASNASNFSDNDEFYYVLNASYSALDPLVSSPNTGYRENRFFLKAAQYGKFGFYSTGVNKYWYGRVEDDFTNAFGNDAWYFDTKYLWDWKQDSGNIPGQNDISHTKVWDAFYDDGVFRLLLEPPTGGYREGFCKRPVGLYAIDQPKRNFVGEGLGSQTNVIHRGFYPLRSHCLSPAEYHHSTEYNSGSLNYNGAGIIFVDADDDTRAEWDASANANNGRFKPRGAGYIDDTNYTINGGSGSEIPYQFTVGVGHDEGVNFGDWQFASGSENRFIGLGVSLLYDDFEDPSDSNISPLVSIESDGTSKNYVEISGGNDQALSLYWQLHVGKNSLNTDQNEFLAHNDNGYDFAGVHSIAEFRGSGMNNGYSNFGVWNPRIVGARIWMTLNNDGPIDDPLLLATLQFNNDKDRYGLSVAHDGTEATGEDDALDPSGNWLFTPEGSVDGTVSQFIDVIKGVPNATYSLLNGYKHNENIHAWYKTSAIVNRKLYVGNVSYYDKISGINLDEAPVNYPDRILVSPPNKFDILPKSSFLDIIVHDSQDIVKLAAFNKNLLVFKHDDLFVIDCSGELEVLASTHKGMGVVLPTQVCITPNAVYWINSQGVYGIDAENPPANIIKSKIPTSEWESNIYNNSSHIEYEPQDNLLMIFSRWDTVAVEGELDSNVLIINLNTGGVFFKTNPGIRQYDTYSQGLLFNNKLYISSMFLSDSEIFSSVNTRVGTFGTHAEAIMTFKISNSSHPNQLGGTEDKYLFIRKGSSWVRVNDNPLYEATTFNQEQWNNLMEQYNAKMNNDVHNNDYDHSLSYDETGEFFIAYVKAKEVGTAFTMSPVYVSGAVDEYGLTVWALSGTAGDEPDAIGDITDFNTVNNTVGVDSIMPRFTIYADRAGSSTSGVAYNLTVNFTVANGDMYEQISITASYLTSTDPSSLYNAAESSAYSNDSDPSANNLTNSNALTVNLHEFLQNNPHSIYHDLTQYFSFTSVITDTDGSNTGTANLKYFIMEATDSSSLSGYDNITTSTYVDGGRGGSMVKWESQTNSALNNVLLETQDYDFEEPNIRKKVYKAYITYKLSGKVKVYYQVNQSGTWVLADVTDSTTDNTLLTSTQYRRGEVTFGTGGNSIYSIALKFASSEPIEIFDINDISLIFRPKRVK